MSLPAEEPEKPPPEQSYAATVVHNMKQKLIHETINCVLTTFVLAFTLTGCVLCFIYFPYGLPVITLLSCCLCQQAHYYNIPLWVSLLLFVFWVGVIQLKRVVISVQ